MLGAIVGDIIGSVHEFWGEKTMDFPLFVEQSRFTDDTVLTIAVADFGVLSVEDPVFKRALERERSPLAFVHDRPAERASGETSRGGSGVRVWLIAEREVERDIPGTLARGCEDSFEIPAGVSVFPHE